MEELVGFCYSAGMVRHRKTIMIVMLAAVLMFVGSGYLNGLRLKKSLQQIISPQLSTRLEIGSAYLNAFTGNGYLENIRILNPPGFIGPHALFIKRIDIMGGPTSLHGEVITLDQLHVQGVEAVIIQTGQGNNFMKIWQRSGVGSDYGLKEIQLQRFEMGPAKIFLGPQMMNQNPFTFSLPKIEISQDQLKNQKLRTFGRHLSGAILDEIEALDQAGSIPLRPEMVPWTRTALARARTYLKKYQ